MAAEGQDLELAEVAQMQTECDFRQMVEVRQICRMSRRRLGSLRAHVGVVGERRWIEKVLSPGLV